jgi:hypothetical protein
MLSNRFSISVVNEFLEREDKSTTLPGKKDTKAIDKKAKQKHDLSDYMLNLFDSIQLEDQRILEEEKFEDTKGVIISCKWSCFCFAFLSIALVSFFPGKVVLLSSLSRNSLTTE